MYQPAHFREDRLAVQHAMIRAHSLGLLVTAGPGGLQANHVPFLVDAGGPERGTLRAHLARANPQLDELAAVAECMVVFQGPQTYINRSLYPTKHEHGKAVPTWNYITVHAWGRPQVIDDAAWLRRQVDDLTSHKEDARPAPWAVSDAPESYVAAQLKGIVGIEIPIARIEGKWKVSQNRPAVDQAGVVAGLRGDGGDAVMAALIAERAKNAKNTKNA
jgi:transcriptional regulator